MRLFIPVIFTIVFIIDYVKNKKFYMLLGLAISFSAIIIRIPYINAIVESHLMIFKYSFACIAIIFLFLALKEVFLLFKGALK